MCAYVRIPRKHKYNALRMQQGVMRFMDVGVIMPHFHSTAEIIHVTYGEISVSVNGRKFKLSENDFLLITPETVHEISYGFSCEFWTQEFAKADAKDFFDSSFSDNLVCSKFKCSKRLEMEYCNFCLNPLKIYNDRLVELMEEPAEIDNMLYSDIHRVLGDVLDECILYGEACYCEKRIELAFYNVLNYISSNFHNCCHCTVYADQIGENYDNLRKRISYFCKQIGYDFNFANLVSIRRCQLAKYLLMTTDMSIGEIVSKTGFLYYNQLTKYFKRYMGMTPSKYRKTVRCAFTKDVFR